MLVHRPAPGFRPAAKRPLDRSGRLRFLCGMPRQSDPGDDAIEPLREALRHSPSNVPLRQHLADTLLAHNRGEEAEKEYREAIALAPGNVSLQVGLARAF